MLLPVMGSPTDVAIVSESRSFLLDGRWRVLPALNRIIDGETEHSVPDKQMQVLVVLIERGGVVSRAELFDAVWPDTIVVEESLTRAISSLRKLFDDDPRSPRVIETIPKKGYRILVSVQPSQVDFSSPSGVLERPPRTRQIITLAATAGLVTVLVIGAIWLGGGNRNEVIEPVQQRLTSLPGIEEYPTLSPSGDRLAFVWDGDGQEPDAVFVQVLGVGHPVRLTHTVGHYAFPAWTHDSRFLAYARVAGEHQGLFEVPATGGEERELLAAAPGELLQTPEFSPDGRWLLYARLPPEGGQWRLERLELATGRTESLAPSSDLDCGGLRPRFAPDGRLLAFFRDMGSDWDLVVVSLDTWNLQQVETDGRAVVDFAWTVDGSGLVLSNVNSLRIVELDGSLRRVLTTTRASSTLSVSGEPPLVAFSDGEREKNIWQWSPSDGGTEGKITRLVHSTGWDSRPSLSPDGHRLALLSDRSGSTQLWLASRDGSEPHRVTDLPAVMPVRPAWSPDGERIALTVGVEGSSRVCVVQLSTGRTQLLVPTVDGESHGSWSKDGLWLYVTRTTSRGSEIWRRRSDGSQQPALVIADGSQPVVTADGSMLYFSRGRRANRTVWRCGVDGRGEERVLALPRGELLAWSPVRDGLVLGYRLQPDARTYWIARHEFARETTTDLFSLESRLGLGLDVDSDGSIIFDQTDRLESDIVAISGF